MRKFVLSFAAAGAALIAASPAAAQYYPQAQPYGYNNGYKNGFGFQNSWGQFRALQARLNNVERQINRLDRGDRVSERTADRLRHEANRIERRLRDRARGGLDPREAGEISYRIQRLEQQVQYSLASGYGRYGYNNGNRQWVDRDRDGRDDNREHQRWHDQHDGDHDD